MKRSVKVALCLVAAGIILMFIGYNLGGFKSIKVTNQGFSTFSFDTDDLANDEKQLTAFKDIDLKLDYGDVEIINGDSYYIEANYNKKSDNLSYVVEGDTLTVKNKSERKM